MPKNYCIMQIRAESGKSALPICNYSQILYQFLTFTQNLKRSLFGLYLLFNLTDNDSHMRFIFRNHIINHASLHLIPIYIP